MPYIKPDQRDIIDPLMDDVIAFFEGHSDAWMDGAVNYLVTRIIKSLYMYPQPSYYKINRAIGLLECIKQEFYRTEAGPYEDIKANENGPVVPKPDYWPVVTASLCRSPQCPQCDAQQHR